MVPQVLLQHSDTIARVVEFYRVDGKGISEPVGTNIMYFPAFGVNQTRKSGSLSAVPDDLPGAVAACVKER